MNSAAEISTSYPALVVARYQDSSYPSFSLEFHPSEDVVIGLSETTPAVGSVRATPVGANYRKTYFISPAAEYASAIITANMGYYTKNHAPEQLKLRIGNTWDEPSPELADIEMTMVDVNMTEKEMMALHEHRLAEEPEIYQPGFTVEEVQVVYQSLLFKTPRFGSSGQAV